MRMTDEEKARRKIIRDFFAEIGSRGGKKTSSTRDHAHYVSIGKKGGRPKKLKDEPVI